MAEDINDNPYNIKNRKLERTLQQISITIALLALIALTFGGMCFLVTGKHGDASAAEIATMQHIGVTSLIVGAVLIVADVVFTRTIIKRGLSEPLPGSKRSGVNQ